jgi:hypothetical protein
MTHRRRQFLAFAATGCVDAAAGTRRRFSRAGTITVERSAKSARLAGIAMSTRKPDPRRRCQALFATEQID